MSECSHNCSSCNEDCASRTAESLIAPLHGGASVKKVIGVVSGKGGVGKSLVTSLLASETQRQGLRAAILDADITGPSIPHAFGINEHVRAAGDFLLPSYTRTGIQLMSINLILEKETDHVAWRGPVIAGAVTQFWTDVMWDNVDYMFVDMPPGTGDVALTVFQALPVDGVIIVTTPQDLVSMIVSKAVNMANDMNIPVIGIVENMSYFKCSKCGEEHYIFGDSKVESVAEEFGIPYSTKLPIAPIVSSMVDEGKVEYVSGGNIVGLCKHILNTVK